MGQWAFRMTEVERRARLQIRHVDQRAFVAGHIWDNAWWDRTALTRQQVKYAPFQERGRLGDQAVLVNGTSPVGVRDMEIPNLRTRRTLWAIGLFLDIDDDALFTVDLREKFIEGRLGFQWRLGARVYILLEKVFVR